MTFAISGVRMLSAAKDFEAIKSSKYVKDVYTIMTLDDSMVRFVVEFNGPVSYEVKEMMDPASLLLKLKADDSVEDSKLYSVRTVSYSFGESIGHIEEKLKDYANLRVLKDQEGTFAVEVGLFESENEAERILRELNQDFDIDFFIEARMGNDEPTGKGIQDNLDAENPDDEAESGDTADKDSKIEVDEESGFSVSVTENSNQFYGVVMLNETGIEIYDEYMEKVELSFSYKEVKLSKLHGEASFILQIEKGDRVINVSGVYSDFFEKLDTYWSID